MINDSRAGRIGTETMILLVCLGESAQRRVCLGESAQRLQGGVCLGESAQRLNHMGRGGSAGAHQIHPPETSTQFKARETFKLWAHRAIAPLMGIHCLRKKRSRMSARVPDG